MKTQKYDKFFGAFGVLGACILLVGHLLKSPEYFFIFGSIALLITALHYQLIYFIALECILTACYLSMLLGISFYSQTALPILLCFQLLVFFLMLGKQNFFLLIIGIGGIVLLSLGLSYENQWMYCIGSSAVAFYAFFMAYKGSKAAYIWAGLNTVFAIMALYQALS